MTNGKISEQAVEMLNRAKAWWTTRLIDIRPGVIRIKGEPIENLIGNVGYAHMVWLMLRDEPPTPAQTRLLEAALVAAVDHGPQAPSIAISRMAVTCGAPLNGAMASAINVLDDIHGGAGQQCLALFQAIDSHAQTRPLDAAVQLALDGFVAEYGKVIPGYGHRFHPVDPRAVRLLALVDAAQASGEVEGRFARIGRQVEKALGERTGKQIPMNIDGATAVVYGELGFAPELARGLFILSRSVGILAHAWEQKNQGGRIKGPMPPDLGYTYLQDN
ncbi:citryl-CoA lyase [Noviherbaspirillum sp. CPCC 100848]|uniref:citrate synthase (unknown stereospecificity) n=1 Tax=Noviherbaspirillum album TaxID=3080276 RepID=A0ABU6JEI6_9BURK|nr:citryl-CoA lyase [Noviherbaspirillum sp. CPCC 100848]MEC4721690.1 citryl-CoA lyase [Noviherbaspirillum sp. CPCC 100848]